MVFDLDQALWVISLCQACIAQLFLFKFSCWVFCSIFWASCLCLCLVCCLLVWTFYESISLWVYCLKSRVWEDVLWFGTSPVSYFVHKQTLVSYLDYIYIISYLDEIWNYGSNLLASSFFFNLKLRGYLHIYFCLISHILEWPIMRLSNFWQIVAWFLFYQTDITLLYSFPTSLLSMLLWLSTLREQNSGVCI